MRYVMKRFLGLWYVKRDGRWHCVGASLHKAVAYASRLEAAKKMAEQSGVRYA